ncbi:MAG: hypothetical protein GWN83_21880, partial [Gemmatimonadetes bacterium]|nr:hypothetical protein [Gemmatimonadota bacterium]
MEFLHKSSVSSPGMAYLGFDPTAGVPTIFGVADVAAWDTVELVKVGDSLPGGEAITELRAFDLAGKKLVFSAKKAGGEGLYE